MFGFCLTHQVRRLASVCFSVSSQIYCVLKTNTMSLVWIRAYSTGAPLYSHQVSKTTVKLLISTFSNRMVRLEKKWPLLFSWSTSKDHEIKPSWWVQTSCLFFSVKDFKVWNKEHTLIINNVDKWNNLMLVGLNNGDIFFIQIFF